MMAREIGLEPFQIQARAIYPTHNAWVQVNAGGGCEVGEAPSCPYLVSALQKKKNLRKRLTVSSHSLSLTHLQEFSLPSLPPALLKLMGKKSKVRRRMKKDKTGKI